MPEHSTTGNNQAIADTAVKIAQRLVQDPGRVANSLDSADRAAYQESKRSVIDARRHAESHEGMLKIS
jgi:hypothetical protein